MYDFTPNILETTVMVAFPGGECVQAFEVWKIRTSSSCDGSYELNSQVLNLEGSRS